ncbi:IPT/TIG domain protein [Marine Group I thaumarchaeote SCGC RSA3]|uniref:IPT/TIG domain protein n=1 Tax=Marine Group I thaumarchaeote SCGC RSA3 TaxID=1503183 RepID=A0A087RQI4_9ARCH|nr:IPT/TIG domain protein [Marine Group I thaumarchaeote SCGC RSA3]
MGMGKDTVKYCGNDRVAERDEFDVVIDGIDNLVSKHSRQITAIFLMSIMLLSVSVIPPYAVYAANETLLITADNPNLVLPPTTPSAQEVTLTFTRSNDWTSGTNSFTFDVFTDNPNLSFYVTGDGTGATDELLGTTVNFGDDATLTKDVTLKIKSSNSAFGSSKIYIDAMDVSTGSGGDILDAFFDINITVGDSSTPLITMNVTSAEIGDTIAIDAHNFAISETVTVTLTAPNGTTNTPALTSSSTDTDSNGDWGGTLVIPGGWSDGQTEVKLSTSSSFSEDFLTIFSGGGFSVSASPSTLNLAPPPDTDSTAVSETMKIGYSPYGGFSNKANFTINGLPPGITSHWSTNSYTTNNTFSSSVPIANTTFTNVDVWFTSDESTAFGDYPITVTGTDITDDAVFESVQATLSIPPPLASGTDQIQGSLSLSPSFADVGDTVTFSGNIGASLSDRAVSLTLDGNPLTTLPASITTSFSTSTTFSGSFVVPSGSSGALEVEATLTDDNFNTISLKENLSILSSTDSYTATMSPENLPVISPGTTSDTVTMTANGIAGKGSNTVDVCVWGLPMGVGVIFPDESSSLDPDMCSDEFTVPAGGTLSKSFQLKADSFAFPGPIMGSVDICNTSTWECKLFTLNSGISAPSGSGFASVFLSTNYAEAGDSLTVTASGFDGSETLTVSVLGNTIATKSASSGSATINLTLPSTLTPGFYPIKVTGGTSGTVAEAGLDVFSTSGTGSSSFNIALSPNSLPPMQQNSIPNQNTNMTITVDAFSGQSFTNDEATLTIYGLPSGVAGSFKVNSVQGSYSNSPSVTLDVSPGGQNKTTLSFNVDSFAMLGPFHASIDVDSGNDYQFKDFSTSILAPTGSGGMMNYFEGLSEGDQGFAMKELFSIGSVFVSPSSFMEGDTVTVTASGFNAGAEVDVSIMDSVGSHINITSSGTPVFDSSGSWSGKVSIPTTTNIIPGMSEIEVSDKAGREAESPVTILDSSSTFSLSVSPTNIPPMSAGTTSDVTFIVKGLSGKDPGAVYLEFPSGMPYGVTGCFDTNNQGNGVDCTNQSNFGDVPTSKLSPGLGGTSKTILKLDVDDYAQPGPVFLDVRAYTVSEGSDSTIYDVGDQEFYLPIDSNISPSSNFNAGFGTGGSTNFFGTEGSFKDFSTMQSDFATIYGADAFNAFTIAELFVSPTSGTAGDAITLTATGFQPGENVEKVYFGGTNMTIPKSQTFDSSGSKTFNFKIPSSFTDSGYYEVEVCSLTGMCAYSDFYIVDANDAFNAFSTPSMLPPINAGQITDAATITVKSLSGKSAGTVTLSIDYLPHDVTACFGSSTDCDESSEFSSAPVSTTLTPAVGGTSSAKLRYNIDEYVSPGPKFVDVIVTSSENSQQQMLFVDFDVMGKQDFFHDDFMNMFSGTGGEGGSAGMFSGGDYFNAYTIGSVSIKPASGKAGDQVTITASGFSASTEITELIFGDKTLPIPESANATNTSGVFTTKLAVPTGLSTGFHPIDICAEDGMCAYSDFNVIDANSKFTLELSQQFLSPFSAGEDSQQVSVTLKATKGNDPGEIDVEIPFLPPGVTAQFGSEGFSSNPSISLTTGVGGTNKTTLTFRADSYAPPGPLFAMIEALPTSGTMQSLPIDSSIGSKSNFGGFMMGAGSFMGDMSGDGFKDFSTMQNDFMGTYGNDAFNAFTIADLYVNPAAGATGTAVTLSATGFPPSAPISEIMFGDKNIPVPSGTTADASGSFSTTISVPTGLSGFQPIDLCTTNGMCAFSDFKISGANDVFIATASPWTCLC